MTTATATPTIVSAIAAYWGGTEATEATEAGDRTWTFGKGGDRYQVWAPGATAHLREDPTGRPFTKRVPKGTYFVAGNEPGYWTVDEDGTAHTWGDPVNVLDRYTPPEIPPTITTSEEAAARLAWLDEALDSFHEWWGETYGQYRAEVAMYGDAWPGSAVQLADAREEASRWEAERKALIETWSAPAPPPEPPAPWTPTDEEPF